MIILHVFAPSAAAVRKQATWSTLEVLRRHGRHVVIDWPCKNDGDFARALALVWGHDDICVLEHDLVPQLEHVLELERCPHLVCTQAYQLRFGDADPVYAFRNHDDVGGDLRWGREGESMADYFPLGLTRIRRRAMQYNDVDIFAGLPWQSLDVKLSELLARDGRAHVHWPAIAHHHSG